jgi:hypothetical protein
MKLGPDLGEFIGKRDGVGVAIGSAGLAASARAAGGSALALALFPLAEGPGGNPQFAGELGGAASGFKDADGF